MSPKPQPRWVFNMLYNMVTNLSDTLDGHLLNKLKYLLENHSTCFQAALDSVHSKGFSGVRGWFRNCGPADISQSHEAKTLLSVLENRHLPRTQELETRLIHFQALCHKPYLVVREGKELFGLLFIFTDDFLIAVSNMPSFFKVLQRGLGTEAYGNRADS